MHRSGFAALTISGVLAVTSLAAGSDLQAQAAPASRFHLDSAVPPALLAVELNALTRDRTARWATSAHVIHCGPAPLTERPGVESEFARPRVTPLESAFADAAAAKRSVAFVPIRSGR
ncbi:MAG: hypothetical protein ACREMZ_13005 [Gemmatimonadales bacterium]